jgi:hypothetical protein
MMTLTVSSCSKWIEDLLKGEGSIPGLGNVTGELTGTQFKLPDGVIPVGDITGEGDQENYWTLNAPTERMFVQKDGTVEKRITPVRTRAGEEMEIHYFGSGEGYVDLLITLQNTRSTAVEVTIPAATIFVSKAGDTQNGVLIKKVVFTIPAGSVYRLCLSMYCGNLSRGTAHRGDIYVFGVVSDAKALLDLCDRVKNRKINIEEFSRTSSTDKSIYDTQAEKLQSIVWQITDFSGKLSDSDISYINSLPNSN